jgi:adenylosuccinate synthase|tara:strand:+ start:606 stop:1700 length:1095 start_codon:yes stop_codon:yes gene_type:complete
VKKADMIIDLQFGSTGKGLLAGYLAEREKYDVVITANMPNAGHTFINAQGVKYIHHCLPNGIVSPDIQYVMLGPGAIFYPERLIFELEQAWARGHKFQFYIHEAAVPCSIEHAEIEVAWMTDATNENRIGSTRQGSAAAMVQKIRRQDYTIANDTLSIPEYGFPQLDQYVINQGTWNSILSNARKILLEGSQGYSLGINAGFYPYCTSRDCTPARFMADMAVPLPYLRKVIGTCRVHPIRVGGTSGPGYPDQDEISWTDIGIEPELTTTTKKERRIFTFSEIQIRRAIFQTCPDEVFLNFTNYDSMAARRVQDYINKLHQEYRMSIEQAFRDEISWADMRPLVRYEGTGPRSDQVIDLATVETT